MPCGPILRLAVKENSLLLCREDIRPRIARGLPADKLRDVLAAPLNWIRQTHSRQPSAAAVVSAEVIYPLTDPCPERDDLGLGDLHRLTIHVLHIARAKMIFG